VVRMRNLLEALCALLILCWPQPAEARPGSEIEVKLIGCFGTIQTPVCGWIDLSNADIEAGELLAFSGERLTAKATAGGYPCAWAGWEWSKVLVFQYDGGPSITIEAKSEARGLSYSINGVVCGVFLDKKASAESPFGTAIANKGITCVSVTEEMTEEVLGALDSFPDLMYLNLYGEVSRDKLRTAMKGKSPKWLRVRASDRNICLDYPSLLYAYITMGPGVQEKLSALHPAWKYVSIVTEEGGSLDGSLDGIPECAGLDVASGGECTAIVDTNFEKLPKLKGLSVSLSMHESAAGSLDLEHILTPSLRHLSVGSPFVDKKEKTSIELKMGAKTPAVVALRYARFKNARPCAAFWAALTNLKWLDLNEYSLPNDGVLPSLGLKLAGLDLTEKEGNYASVFTTGFIASVDLLLCGSETERMLPEVKVASLVLFSETSELRADLSKLNVKPGRVWLCNIDGQLKKISVACPEGIELQIIVCPTSLEKLIVEVTQEGVPNKPLLVVCSFRTVISFHQVRSVVLEGL